MKWFATGAYGRAAKLADWEAGKDFRFVDGPYFSIRDTKRLIEQGVTEIEFCGSAGDFTVELKKGGCMPGVNFDQNAMRALNAAHKNLMASGDMVFAARVQELAIDFVCQIRFDDEARNALQDLFTLTDME